MSEYLSATEVRDLTDSARRAEQQRRLGELGIPFLVSGRRIVVSREHVRARLEGRTVRATGAPNLALVR